MTTSRRMPLLIATAGAALLFGQKPVPQKVVFVCEHGAAKSVIAAAEFGRMAKERGLVFDIVSRGTNPGPEIAAGVRQGLNADGLTVGAAKPVKVSAKDLAGAAKVISFGPDLSALLSSGAKALDWSSTPSPGKDYQAARDHIRRQLELLFVSLRQSN